MKQSTHFILPDIICYRLNSLLQAQCVEFVATLDLSYFIDCIFCAVEYVISEARPVQHCSHYFSSFAEKFIWMVVHICYDVHTHKIHITLQSCRTLFLQKSTILYHQKIHEESHFLDSNFLDFLAFIVMEYAFINDKFWNVCCPPYAKSLNLFQSIKLLLKYLTSSPNDVLSESHGCQLLGTVYILRFSP